MPDVMEKEGDYRYGASPLFLQACSIPTQTDVQRSQNGLRIFGRALYRKMYKGVPVTSPESELALDWNSYNQYLFPVVGIAALVVVGQLGKLTDNKGEEASAKLAALLFAVFSYISS